MAHIVIVLCGDTISCIGTEWAQLTPLLYWAVQIVQVYLVGLIASRP